MVIGISGKIKSGKDSVAIIIQGLIMSLDIDVIVHHVQTGKHFDKSSGFEVKSFAYVLKQIVCLLIGCTMEQLEDREFKERKLGKEWTKYGYASGHNDHYRNGQWTKSMNIIWCSKERYEEELRINWQTAYKVEYTPRLLLQEIGTNCLRDMIHPDAHISALFTDYKSNNNKDDWFLNKVGMSRIEYKTKYCEEYKTLNEEFFKSNFSNWIVKDVRFYNEAEAIRDRNGILLRVNRDCLLSGDSGILSQHPSETDLDEYENFDHILDNDGTIIDLIAEVKNILHKENIL